MNIVIYTELAGSRVGDPIRIDLSKISSPITIGRSDKCTYPIAQNGDGLQNEGWHMAIARCQATIVGGMIYDGQFDGTNQYPSRNGIWLDGRRLDRPLKLAAGQAITLGPPGAYEVILSVERDRSEIDESQRTYSGDDLLSLLQNKIDDLDAAVGNLTAAIAKIEAAAAEQKQFDEAQQIELRRNTQRLNRWSMFSVGAIACIFLLQLFFGGTDKLRDQLGGIITSAIALALVGYLQSRQKS